MKKIDLPHVTKSKAFYAQRPRKKNQHPIQNRFDTETSPKKAPENGLPCSNWDTHLTWNEL